DQLIFRPRDIRLSEGERPTHRGVDDGRSARTNCDVVLVRPNEIAGSIGVEISSEAWIVARLQNRHKRIARDQVLPRRKELRTEIAVLVESAAMERTEIAWRLPVQGLSGRRRRLGDSKLRRRQRQGVRRVSL